MAITKSAKKAHRQSLRKKAFNDRMRKAVRVAQKGVREAKKGDTAALAAAYKAIDKSLKRGLMHKNTAARRKAAIAKSLKVVKA